MSLNKQNQIQAAVELALIFVGLLTMLQYLPFQIHDDGIIRFQTISALLEHGKLSDARYSIVGPAFSIPLWFLGKLYQTSAWWLARYNFVLFVVGLLFIYVLLKDRVERGLIRKFFIILIAGSMFANHLSTYFGEVFTALMVGIGIMAAVIGPRLGGWMAVVLGVINAPSTIIGLGFVVIRQMVAHRRLRYVLVIVAVIGLIGAENFIRRGNPLNEGYGNDFGFVTVMPYSGKPGFSYPIFFGVLSILFSFGKGLLFFAPGLLLPVRSRLLRIGQESKLDLYSVYILWIAFLAGLVLLYAHWWAWYGGMFWGPRFFLFASIPASFALATRLQYRDNSLIANLFVLLVLALSVWVGIDGAVFGQQTLDICWAHYYALEFLCHYVPEFSVLWRPFVVAEPLNTNGIVYIVYSAAAFLYLSMPLFGSILQETITKLDDFGKVYLNLKSWHF